MSEVDIVKARAHARLRAVLTEAQEIALFLATLERLQGPNPDAAFQAIPPATVAQTVPAETPSPIIAAGGDAVETPATEPEPPVLSPADPLRSEVAPREDANLAALDSAGVDLERFEHSPGAFVDDGTKRAKPAIARVRRAGSRVALAIALHANHPELTARQAADRLGIALKNFRAVTAQAKISWAPAARGRPRAESPASASSTPAAATPAATSERPPAAIRPPVAATPSAIVATPMQRPKGKLFWLRNADGEYLNRFCTGMTRDRREAWTGTGLQVEGCRRNFAIAADLREAVVEKEQPRIAA